MNVRSSTPPRATASPAWVVVDARSLQDSDYQFRGVGQHSASLLFGLINQAWGASRPRFIALTDPVLPLLPQAYAQLFDQIVTQARRPSIAAGWFISLSPMTHDPVFVSRFLLDPGVYKICLFYDLIPFEQSARYLRRQADHMDFVTCIAWASKYDTFAAISRYSADRLCAVMSMPLAKMFVTGVAVRRSLEPRWNAAQLDHGERKYILVAGGGDPRKNPECALKAFAQSKALAKSGLSIQVTGNYPLGMRERFRAEFQSLGGDVSKLIFLDHLPDESLHELYARALVTVVASRAEGFSIPIVESSAAGTPALVSNVGAHPELVPQPQYRFHPEDSDALGALLEGLATDPSLWSQLNASQESLWTRYKTDAVVSRFVDGVLERAPTPVSNPAVLRNAKPSIAVLTPLPPAASGVADYSLVTLRALAQHADIVAFSESHNVESAAAFQTLFPTSSAPFRASRCDAVLSVIGNSDHHRGALEYLLDYGGSALAHDARMIDFYVHEFGMGKAIEIASRELGRPVSVDSINYWLNNQRDLPVLFLSDIVKSASPLLVHSPVTAARITELYAKVPVTLPFAQYRNIDRMAATPEARAVLRERMGFSPDDVVICTFGFVSNDKAPDELIWALRLLVDWGINCRLAFVGSPHDEVRARLISLIKETGLSDRVALFEGHVPEHVYNDYLFAGDISIQLRGYHLGGLSGALNDCIAAAMPSIANRHLAEAMTAPSYVKRISDYISPVLLAEAVGEIVDSGLHRERPLQEAQAFGALHSADRYASLLFKALGF